MSTRSIHQDFTVRHQYPVHFTRGVFDLENPLLSLELQGSQHPGKVLFVLDEGVESAFPNVIHDIERYFEKHGIPVAQLLILPGGEQVKNDPSFLVNLYEALDVHHIDRHDHVVVLGGGAVTDLVGFAAATSHRGIRLIRLPSTVLSQNDAAVGVKTSVNLFGKKNWLGTFTPPKAVINDLLFLTGLSQRDWLSGLAEAVKVALIKDRAFFEWLERHAARLSQRDLDAMEYAVFRCAELHLEHIGRSGDPFERGSSRPLDYGHWAAHKLESLSAHRIRHGEAVAFGVALDAMYAHLTGMLSARQLERILHLFRALRLPYLYRECAARDAQGEWALLAGLQEFREHLGGRLTISLIPTIGEQVDVHHVDACILEQAYTNLVETEVLYAHP